MYQQVLCQKTKIISSGTASYPWSFSTIWLCLFSYQTRVLQVFPFSYFPLKTYAHSPHPNTPTSANLVTSATFGKNGIDNGFSFLTYECCRRRLPSIKMINVVEEVVVLLFTAFEHVCLFWKYRLTRVKSEVIYSGKDLTWFIGLQGI